MNQRLSDFVSGVKKNSFSVIVHGRICKVVRIFIKKKNDEASLRISNLRMRNEKAVYDGFAEFGRM